LLKLVFGKTGIFLTGRQIFFPDFYHGVRYFKTVVDHVDADFDFVLNALKVLYGLGHFIPPFSNQRPAFAGIEDVIVETDAEGAKIPIQKRYSVLIAVAGDRQALDWELGGVR